MATVPAFSNQSLPTETALGKFWNIEENAFTFKVKIKLTLKTRRDMLSAFIGIYDLFGFAALTLQGRRKIHKLCEKNLKWDETVPKAIQEHWEE